MVPAAEGLPDLGSLSYEALVALLEDLTRQMASGDVGIEEAALLYEQAGLVHRAATERLANVTARLAAIAAEGAGALDTVAETGPRPPGPSDPAGAGAG